jgi:hypothetical protein
MHSPARPGRRSAARLLAGLAIASLAVGACGGSSTSTASPAAASQAPASQAAGGGGGAASGDPASVVQDAIAKLGAKDFAGLASIACAGQADQIRNMFGASGNLGTDLQIPGLDSAAFVDSVTFDMSKVQVGSATVSGNTATVPVSGSMSVNFDKDKLRPILKQVMAQNGTSMTDQQLDTLIDSFATGQSVPLTEPVPLVNEGGSWKICPKDSGGSSAAPSSAPSGSSY